MNRNLLSFLLMLLTLTAFAQQAPQPERITGDWTGSINAGGMQLATVFHISAAPDGSFAATMDVPAQGAKGIPVKAVTLTQDSLFLDIPVIGGKYAGKVTPAGTVEGNWKQAGQSFPLVLRKGAAEPPKRPQEPQPPFPYQQEDVTVTNKAAGITLAGTLTLPQGKGPHPAVLLLTGSGPQDRDETILGHKPFLVLADHLTRQGIAVLRLDDRGIGKSGGNFAAATTKDFAADAQAAYRFLKSRKGIDAKKVGLLGHSEGGIMATMLAAQHPDVAFVVLLAGSGVKGVELLTAQNEALYKAMGVPQEPLRKLLQVRQAQFEAAAAPTDKATAEARIAQLENEAIASFSAAEQQGLGLNEQNKQALVAQLTTPWTRYFLAYDPAPDLRKMKMPVLALNGSKDLQVPPQQNLPAIERALKAAGNKSYSTKELPHLNHLFQTATTGLASEYGTIEETLAPVVLETVGNWLNKTIKEK